MSNADETIETLGRRRLLSGGAAATGVAVGGVALGLLGARPAAAANGQAVTVGGSFTGTSATKITTSGATVPAIEVGNPDGPALKVDLRTSVPDLRSGEISAYDGIGLVVGAEDDQGAAFTSPVATLDDVYGLPIALPGSGRLADTRSSGGRTGITVVSGPGYDSKYRLRGGTTVDVRVDDSQTDYLAVFLNVTVTGPTAAGFVFAYSPELDPRPSGSTLNYTAGQTVANGTLAGVVARGASTYVRLYVSSTSHVIVDLTGMLITQLAGPGAAQRTTSGRSAARRITSRRPMRRR